MPALPKPTPEAPAAPAAIPQLPAAPVSKSGSSLPAMIGDWIRQGAEGIIATQKILLDLAAQQNALALTIIRERFTALPTISLSPLVEFAGKAAENFMAAEKVLLDLASQETNIVHEGFKPGLAGTPVAGVANVVSQSVDTLIGAQKHFLELAQQETEAALKDYRDKHTIESAHLTELARGGVKTFVDTQRKFLDIVEQSVTGKKPAEAPPDPGVKKVDIFEMARQGVDTFIEAQKKLLDLASDQIGANVQLTKDIFAAPGGEQPHYTSIADVMRKSADSFVAAQKALMELAAKPERTATGAVAEAVSTAAAAVSSATDTATTKVKSAADQVGSKVKAAADHVAELAGASR
jgi:hypothetical protein